MRLPLRLLAALAAVLFVLLPTTVSATPGPADGCGELALTDQDAVAARGERADDVFVGRVIALDGAVLQVQVQQVLAGDNRTAGKPVEVQLLPADATVDPRLRVGGRYIFFTEGAGRKVGADGCNGFVVTSLLDKQILDLATVTQLREFLAAPVEPPPVDLGNPPVDADDTPDLGRLVAPGGAISLIGILGLLLIGRISRQR